MPTYTYTDLIEKLNKNFSIDTSKEIIEHKNFKKIINQTKKQKITHFLSNKKIS